MQHPSTRPCTRRTFRGIGRGLLLGLLPVLAIAALAGEARAQADTRHYIPPFFARVDAGDHVILLTTLETTPFSVTMRDGAGTLVHTFTGLARTTPQTLQVAGNGYNQIGILDATELNLANNEGLVLTADKPFTVNVRHRTSEQGLSLTSKGTFGLGTDFRSGHIISNDTDVENTKSHFISVMASEDGTQVTFSDIKPGIVFHGGGGNPFQTSVNLDAGESYVIGYQFDLPTGNLANDPNDVNGTRVTSTKPIAFSSGSWQGGNAEGNRKDMDADQAVSVERLGTSFVVIKGDATSRAHLLERPGVVAAEDGTQVSAGGVLQATIDAGEYHFIASSAFSANGNMFIETSKPAFLYQSTSANDQNAMGMSFIPPLRCNGSKEVVVSEPNLLGTSAVGIVARAGASVSVNGTPLSGGLSVPGTSDWVTYVFDAPAGTDPLDIVSDNVINVALVTRAGDRGASGYFTGFADAPQIGTTTTDLCSSGSILLSTEAAVGYASFQWYRNGNPIDGATASSYSATLPGSYTVVGVFVDDQSAVCAGQQSAASEPIVLTNTTCVCGDGNPTGAEECDDGNLSNTDACLNDCTIAECGDGFLRTGFEECDDGNMVDTDACTNACTIAECGDGITGPGEQCDDGNVVDTDACTNACTNAVCGDGITGPGEECDDGNTVDTDACTNACTDAGCGDGIVGPGEECDDGNTVNTDACTNTCTNAECGDGITGPGEECDDGNMNDGDFCTNACTDAECGDSIVGPDEECDDGGAAPDDGCSPICVLEFCGDGIDNNETEECDDGNMVDGDACTNACTIAECGDGVTGPGEECDDGNTVEDDSCANDCTLTAVCGDTIVGPGEECDDGDLDDGDGCDSTCTVEECWTCAVACTPLDGVACDDGDTCTVGETCNMGVCEGGEEVLFAAACDWIVVGESEPGGDVNLRNRARTEVYGDICLDQANIGQDSIIEGNVVATNATGTDGVRIAGAFITGDIVTGGAGIRGTKVLPLPHTDPIVGKIPTNTVITKVDPPGGVYDTTGLSPLVAECTAALTAVDAAKAPIDALGADQTNARVRINKGATLLLTPTNVGGVNVIDFERLQSAPGATLEISGGGDPETIMIVRVQDRFALRGRSVISAVNGMDPSKILLYGRGKKMQLGSAAEATGTLYALGKVKIGNAVVLDGQIFGRRNKIKLGNQFVGTLVPNLIVLP